MKSIRTWLCLTLVLMVLVGMNPHRLAAQTGGETAAEAEATLDAQALEGAFPASRNVEVISQFGGRVSAMAVQDGYAFVGVGRRLVVLDLSNPLQPAQVGSVLVLKPIQGIVAAGSRVYVGFKTEYFSYSPGISVAFQAVDVSNPASPVASGYFRVADSIAHMAAVGEYVLLAGKNGLWAVNVVDSAQPAGAGFFPEYKNLLRLAMDGNLLYVSANDDDVRVLDVVDPRHPRQVGVVDVNGLLRDDPVVQMTVANGYLYAMEGDWRSEPKRLQILDVHDLSAPRQIFTGEDWLGEILVHGTRALVAATQVTMLDVSDPAHPIAVGLPFPADADWHREYKDLSWVGDYLYVLNPGAGHIQILDPSEAEVGPMVVGSLSLPAMEFSILLALQEPYAYLGHGVCQSMSSCSGVIHVVDISVPTAPVLRNSLALSDAPTDLLIQGSRLYVTGQLTDLHIFELSDPIHPGEIGRFSALGEAKQVVVQGDYAYVRYWQGAEPDRRCLRVLDISNPAAPVEIGSVDLSIETRSMAVAGQFLYLFGAHIGRGWPGIPRRCGQAGGPGRHRSGRTGGNRRHRTDPFGRSGRFRPDAIRLRFQHAGRD